MPDFLKSILGACGIKRKNERAFCLSFCSSLEGEVHYSIEQAVKFIEERITEESKSSRPLRGPYLAKLELIRRLRYRGCNDEYKLGKSHSWVMNAAVRENTSLEGALC